MVLSPFDALEFKDLVSIVSFKIDSGKKHQIRAHAAQVLRTPILFDEKYGYSTEKFTHERFVQLLGRFPTVLKK